MAFCLKPIPSRGTVNLLFYNGNSIFETKGKFPIANRKSQPTMRARSIANAIPSMPLMNVAGTSLAYDDVGPPDASLCVVLIHGFASNRNENWRRIGWLGAFERRRIRAIAFDLPGHGESDKPHDPAAYTTQALIAHVFGIADALAVHRPVLMGYSMGARLALAAAAAQPGRFDRLILGGVGVLLLTSLTTGNPLAQAMETTDPDTIANPLIRSFRQFADEQGADHQALAACARAHRESVTQDTLHGLRLPTLVVAGSRDMLAGSPEELAALIPNGHGVTLPGCDHFSAIPHALFKAAVFDFLEEAAL